MPYSQDKCNVIVPGGGERVFALTGDDELAFALSLIHICGRSPSSAGGRL